MSVTISAVPQVDFQACKGYAQSCWLSAACHEGVTKLVTLRQSIQISFFYKPIKLDKSIKPQPTFEYRFVLRSRIGTTRLYKFSRF